MSETREWFAGLKPGDRVFYKGRFNDAVLVVKRLTKTQIICVDSLTYEYKFRISSGFNVGGDVWDRSYISPLTEEKIAHIRRISLTQKAIVIRKKIAIPGTEDELISFIADLEKWVPKATCPKTPG